MARVKIKHLEKTREKKSALLNILSQHGIYATNVIPTNDGFVVLNSNDDEMDKIFTDACMKELDAGGFTPILPPEMKAKRTVLLFNVDEEIMKQTTDEIEGEIYRCNAWAPDSIHTIFKFPRNPILKITYKQTAPANKSKDQGILMFSMRIPPHQIKAEEYIPIKTCMRCYKIEQHFTNQCPEPKEYKLCSQCGETGHLWSSCTSSTKKCILCTGDHMSLAYKCPERKRVRQAKLDDLKAKKSQTYASTTNTSTVQTTSQLSFPPISQEATTKIVQCMLEAHSRNLINPGTYEEELNKLYAANNLPQITIPTNPQSDKLFNVINSQTKKSTITPTAPPTEDESPDEDEASEGDAEGDLDGDSEEEPLPSHTGSWATEVEEEDNSMPPTNADDTQKHIIKFRRESHAPPPLKASDASTSNNIQVRHESPPAEKKATRTATKTKKSSRRGFK